MSDTTKDFESQWLADEEQASQADAEAQAARQAAVDKGVAADDEYLKAHAELEGEDK